MHNRFNNRFPHLAATNKLSLSTVILTVILFLVLHVIGAFVMMFAWNLLAHDLFGAPAIGFLHGLAINVILSFLSMVFKS